MKKKIFAIIAVAVAISLLFSACTFNASKKESDASAASSGETQNTQKTDSSENSTTSEFVIPQEGTTAENQIKGTGIALSEKQLTLYPGQKYSLTAKITPASSTDNKSVVWKSSNPAIASVEGGKINALTKGITQITASLPDGRVASCVVTVGEKTLKQIYGSVSADIGICSSAIKNAAADINSRDATKNKAAYQILISVNINLKRIEDNCYGYETFENSALKTMLGQFSEYMSKANEKLQAACQTSSDNIASDATQAKQYLQKAALKLNELENGFKNFQ